jgi:hypothetical protein
VIHADLKPLPQHNDDAMCTLDMSYVRYLLLLLTGFLLWGACRSGSKLADTEQRIRFFTISEIPVIEGKINGRPAYFIVDTGASCSILNESRSGHFGFTFKSRNAADLVTGLGGEAMISLAYNCQIELGPLKIRSITFRTKPNDYLTQLIRQNEKIDVAGIIGADVLKRYNIRIDFGANTIGF